MRNILQQQGASLTGENVAPQLPGGFQHGLHAEAASLAVGFPLDAQTGSTGVVV